MADIVLPHRVDSGGPPDRRQQIPTAADVPTISLRSDPGVAIPSGAFDNGGAGLVEASKGLASFGNDVFLEAKRQQRLTDATAATRGMLDFEQQGMAELRRRTTQDDPSRAGFEKDYGDWLDQTGQSIVANMPQEASDEARQALQLKIAERRLTMADAAGSLSLKAGQDKALSTAGEAINAAGAQISLYPDHADAIKADLDNQLQGFAGALGVQGEDKLKKMADAAVAQSTVLGYARAGRYSDAITALADEKFATSLTPDQRQSLTGQIHAYQSQELVDEQRRRTLAEQAKKEAQDATANAFVSKLYQPDQNGGPLTIPQVIASNLEPAQKEHMIGLIKQDATGGLAAQFSINVYNDAFAKVAANPYLDFSTEMLPLLGKGLDPTHYDQLATAAKAMQTQDYGALKPILDEAKTISASTIFGKDPLGDHQLMLFNTALRQKIIDAHAKGIPISSLADPKSPNFVGGMIEQFRPSATDMLNARIQQFKNLKDTTDKVGADIQSQGGSTATPEKPQSSVSIPLNLGPRRSITVNGEMYEVLGPASGKDGKPLTDGSLRVRDPVTGRTATYKP